jgi:DNA-binding CsgD family transcriptional regulator
VRALDLAADGLMEKEIAARMNIAESTAHAHLAVARRVLDARNTAHSVRLAIRAGAIAA